MSIQNLIAFMSFTDGSWKLPLTPTPVFYWDQKFSAFRIKVYLSSYKRPPEYSSCSEFGNKYLTFTQIRTQHWVLLNLTQKGGTSPIAHILEVYPHPPPPGMPLIFSNSYFLKPLIPVAMKISVFYSLSIFHLNLSN